MHINCFIMKNRYTIIKKNRKRYVPFYKYRIALKQDKDEIDSGGEDAIDSNRLFFDFMPKMFDHLNQLYGMEKVFLLMQS